MFSEFLIAFRPFFVSLGNLFNEIFSIFFRIRVFDLPIIVYPLFGAFIFFVVILATGVRHE